MNARVELFPWESFTFSFSCSGFQERCFTLQDFSAKADFSFYSNESSLILIGRHFGSDILQKLIYPKLGKYANYWVVNGHSIRSDLKPHGLYSVLVIGIDISLASINVSIFHSHLSNLDLLLGFYKLISHSLTPSNSNFPWMNHKGERKKSLAFTHITSTVHSAQHWVLNIWMGRKDLNFTRSLVIYRANPHIEIDSIGSRERVVWVRFGSDLFSLWRSGSWHKPPPSHCWD